jgi:hypothetical protein
LKIPALEKGKLHVNQDKTYPGILDPVPFVYLGWNLSIEKTLTGDLPGTNTFSQNGTN